MNIDQKLTITLNKTEVNNLFNSLDTYTKTDNLDEQFRKMLLRELRDFLGMDKANGTIANDEIPF